MFVFLPPVFGKLLLRILCVLQFDQGGLVLQKEQYSNKTDKDHKVCIVCLSFHVHAVVFSAVI